MDPGKIINLISAFNFPSQRITLCRGEYKIVSLITHNCVPFNSKYKVPAAELHNQVSLKKLGKPKKLISSVSFTLRVQKEISLYQNHVMVGI